LDELDKTIDARWRAEPLGRHDDRATLERGVPFRPLHGPEGDLIQGLFADVPTPHPDEALRLVFQRLTECPISFVFALGPPLAHPPCQATGGPPPPPVNGFR